MQPIEENDNSELFIIKKGKKYLKGHGYSTLYSYRFNWTYDINEACKLSLYQAAYFTNFNKGYVIKL